MLCANPECRVRAEDHAGGRLQFVEMEVPLNDRTTGAESGFPVCLAPSRYFWLCPACAAVMRIRRWTASRLFLEPIRGLETEEEMLPLRREVASVRAVMSGSVHLEAARSRSSRR